MRIHVCTVYQYNLYINYYLLFSTLVRPRMWRQSQGVVSVHGLLGWNPVWRTNLWTFLRPVSFACCSNLFPDRREYCPLFQVWSQTRSSRGRRRAPVKRHCVSVCAQLRHVRTVSLQCRLLQHVWLHHSLRCLCVRLQSLSTRCFQQFYIVCTVLEFMGVTYRALASVCTQAYFTLGFSLLSLCSLLIRQVLNLQLTFAFPVLLLLTYFW